MRGALKISFIHNKTGAVRINYLYTKSQHPRVHEMFKLESINGGTSMMLAEILRQP